MKGLEPSTLGGRALGPDADAFAFCDIHHESNGVFPGGAVSRTSRNWVRGRFESGDSDSPNTTA
jgi:hypothetical protein